jgi:membrane protein implicated in regulation of membrane protease activity
MNFKEEISIWFFIGLSLLVNGALITGAGLYEWLIRPPSAPVVLYQVHANVWWGGMLLIFGIVYCWHFQPGRQKRQTAQSEASEKYKETHAN